MFTRLKLIREMQEICLTNLSAMTNIPPARLSLIERNLKQPTLNEVIQLSKVLKIHPDCFFQIVDEEEIQK